MIWTEDGVQGAGRFVQRVWRIVNEILAHEAGAAGPEAGGEEALSIRKAAHRALAAVETDIERLAFNRCVAHVYTLTNVLGRALDGFKHGEAVPADIAAALKEAVIILVQLIAPMMPHLAEECWALLGTPGLVAEAAWPQAEAALLVDDTVTLPVQLNGKKRADVTVAKSASPKEVEAATLANEAVQRALEGREPKKVIVVPGRIVNVVV
ncbi:leucine--tRNA ligase [Labrys miyagiensis]